LPRILASDPDLARRAEALSNLVIDASAFLARRENLERLRPLLNPLPEAWLPLAYDDPCHLCHGQQVRVQPRELLDAIPGVHRVELLEAEACCGSAGLHSFAHPEAARTQLASKLVDLEQSGAATLVTANPGCHMQWETGQRTSTAPRPVRHLMEVLAASLG
ncbi:MAG: (Fe-S)-binding protein, partial [Planctomycetes bacterium]|nr:(Fe-S)-binding protein [Planctomycetota bacterium]